MTTKLVIRGVPRAIERDAWWFGAEAPGATPRPATREAGMGRSGGNAIFLLLALVILADFLFWERNAGLSLAVFAIAICVGVAIGRPVREVRRPMGLAVVFVFPVIEYVQALSVLFLVVGVVAAIVWIKSPEARRLDEIANPAVRLVAAMPVRWFRDARSFLSRARTSVTPDRSRARAFLRTWGVPLGGTAILLSLLLDANPVLENWVTHAFDLDVNWNDAFVRGLFWSGMAMILWPLVSITEVVPVTLPRIAGRRVPGQAGLNARSILRALVMFNLVLGVQTAMDLVLLWGDGDLPDGMRYAEYAHRGAYPLLATALLAGAFALASRPFLDEQRCLRVLVLLWLAQNVALCVSSIKRLDLYMDAFGLTYLRLYAMIWIAVVAIGLSLTAWQIWKTRSNRWLLMRYLLLGASVLYAASFVNFAHIIASHNLSSAERTIDWAYLDRLPHIVDPEIRVSDAFEDLSDRLRYRFDGSPAIEGWRDWGFRRWRVEARMATPSSTEVDLEDSGR